MHITIYKHVCMFMIKKANNIRSKGMSPNSEGEWSGWYVTMRTCVWILSTHMKAGHGGGHPVTLALGVKQSRWVPGAHWLASPANVVSSRFRFFFFFGGELLMKKETVTSDLHIHGLICAHIHVHTQTHLHILSISPQKDSTALRS